MKRLTAKVRTVLRLIRFGPQAALELVHAQVVAFTEPRSRLGACGKGTYVNRRCSLASPQNVLLGKAVSIGPENRLWASPRAKLVIEDDVLLGPGVTIVTSNYTLGDRDLPFSQHAWIESDVTIGRRCWLGANVIVLPGVSIGEGAVIAAGAVVTQSIPPFAIAAGIPAKVLKQRP